MSSHTIYVTGFGPFEGHETVNASWEAVKLLPDLLNVKTFQYNIKKLEIPVVYSKSDDAVLRIWDEKPAVSTTYLLHSNKKL